MLLPAVLNEYVLDYLHPDETPRALFVLDLHHKWTWDEWKWNPKRQVVTRTPSGMIHTKIDGFNHSTNGPAVVLPGGDTAWYRKGELHRDNDLPALIEPDGSKWWYRNGRLHRDNDLPAIVTFARNGTSNRCWYVNGDRHRDNGPAIVDADGFEAWFKNGKRFYP